jgi:hypothetical protein
MPDARQLISRAREEAAAYRKTYGEVMPPQSLNDVRRRGRGPRSAPPIVPAAPPDVPHRTSPLPPTAQRLGAFVHTYTQYWYLRPFGASILLAGYDAEAKKHELYCVEPNGTALRYFGFAIGALQGLLAIHTRSCKECLGHCMQSRQCASAAAGKGQRAAKTEIEKAKFDEKTCEESLGLVAKM